MGCRVRLLKSEIQARGKISEWRTKVQAHILKNLEEAELKILNDLAETVLEQETRIADTEEQAHNLIQSGDDTAFGKIAHAFTDTEVRFEGNGTFEQLNQSLPSLGSVNLEDARGMSSADNKEYIYESLPSIDRNKFTEEYNTHESCYENMNESAAIKQHGPVYEFENDSPKHRNIENDNEVEEEVSTGNAPSHCKRLQDYSNTKQQPSENYNGFAHSSIVANADGSDNELPGPSSIERQPQTGENKNASPERSEKIPPNYSSVRKTIEENFDGVSTTSSTLIKANGDKCDYITSNPSTADKQCRLNMDNGDDTSTTRKHVHLDMGKESEYAIIRPQRKTSIQSDRLFGGESIPLKSKSDDSKQDLIDVDSGHDTEAIEHEHVTTRITKWKTFHPDGMHILSDASKDSGRLVILSDGRLVLLCESEDTLTLFDQHFKTIKTHTIKSPKGVCSAKDDLVAIVQSDGHNENVLLMEAKANYLNVVECKKLEYEERTVEIKYGDNRYYLGCCTFKVYVHNENFENIWIINCGKLRCPMISFDYNHVTGTLYTVNSNGVVNCIKNTNTGETDSYQIQGIAVCCHGDKAYILSGQQKYKVVEMYRNQDEMFQQRNVIFLSGTIPIDICLSTDSTVLMVLISNGNFVSVEKYSVQTHQY